MPFGDGSGPGGLGPRTGRGFGYCAGYPQAGFAAGWGFGRGPGRGFGRGFGRWYGFAPEHVPYAPYGYTEPVQKSPEQEKKYLKNQINAMETAIDSLKKRMDEIDKKK